METRARCPAASVLPARPRHRTLRPPCTVESIFRNFTIRRAALIRALTTDEEALFNKCDPGMQLLCLRGNTDGSWEVKLPESCVPISQPEPTLSINISRDKMKRHEWLQEVAVQCDAWLINISFYFAPLLIASERERLFNMINSLKTVQETFLASNTYLRICHLEEEVTCFCSELYTNQVVYIQV
ncbi:PHD finger protein ALFIN-LIKE 1 [Dichanthelium oligosanthes]|uniref:PHD finger protein ALFIN-LIKE n=1 Tax=Dichanthelium oligosanthes TaxID=888268 RepID=A0A1E5UMV1_9POAL|nr:PHD finger protein ALFIN-LIKE 1 [Dichanthelium oligosanthes]